MAPTVPVEFAGQRKSKNSWQKGVTPMMGKTRKISKGYSSGFVPDYRHVVETMGESEGFCNSGRVDTEMTVSENSCVPKRKFFGLNGEAYDRFGVPIQVLSLSKMSLPERKALELRLKRELEQIRIFQKKIATVSSSTGGLSPFTDIHSCSNGYKRPILETSVRAVEVPVSHGKGQAPPGRNKGTKGKKASAGRFDSVKQVLPSSSSSNAMVMKQCETLLNRLMAHQHAWVFSTPVDVVKLKIPDYYTVIKNPMDLGTVKSNLNSDKYMNPVEFASDVRLTFSNAMTYNPPGNDVHIMAETLSKYFEVRFKPIEKKLTQAPEVAVPSRSSVLVETETAAPMPPIKRKKTAPVENKVNQEPVKHIMSDVDKLNLGSELENLLTELPESIIDFLKERSLNGNQTTDDEIEIDLETLSDDTLFTLRKLLDDYLVGKQKNLAKVETCEMEALESGFSNSSVQPCKAKEPIDEDIDVGGNDLPNSSIPPVEIEKDTALRNSKISSSSSSSSDSGSSSSGSDSGSSSGIDSDDAKASVLKSTANGAMDIEQQKKSGPNNAETENDSIKGSSQVEHNSQPDPVSADVDVRPEGETAPPERQVSPDKLYRAALLRSRFADTILKAHETIGKGEKQDPEKLRLEKEELEKRIREEKARLQAEVKAAEEARRNAEAEAAAEAKLKRELEREAARQALQKMEKTVEINENSQFMEDLEMLGVAAPLENIQILIDESSSSDHSLIDGLGGSFKFQGNSSNPLEQLGLFRKDDDHDDDDVEEEPKSAAPPVAADDPEEGEID